MTTTLSIYLIIPCFSVWASTTASGVSTVYELFSCVETSELTSCAVIEQTCACVHMSIIIVSIITILEGLRTWYQVKTKVPNVSRFCIFNKIIVHRTSSFLCYYLHFQLQETVSLFLVTKAFIIIFRIT